MWMHPLCRTNSPCLRERLVWASSSLTCRHNRHRGSTSRQNSLNVLQYSWLKQQALPWLQLSLTHWISAASAICRTVKATAIHTNILQSCKSQESKIFKINRRLNTTADALAPQALQHSATQNNNLELSCSYEHHVFQCTLTQALQSVDLNVVTILAARCC